MEKELKIKISIDKKTGAVKVIGSEFDDLNNKVKKTNHSASSLEKTFLKYVSIGTVIYGVKQAFDLTYASVKKFTSVADDMVLINSRLSLVTESTEEYVKAQKQLLRTSNNARVAISGTTNLYTQLERSTKELSTSQNDLLEITDNVSKSITISGASAMAADAGLLQFTQGIASGVLRGEELNSILEQTPRLAQAIADGMGVSIGRLRALGAQGKLTSEVVLNSLLSQTQIINEEFKKIAINGQSGYTVLNNTIDTTISKIDGQYKATQAIGQVYIAFGQTIDTIFTQLSSGWSNSNKDALWFAQTTSNVVVNFIEGLGYTYDVLETLGDEFSILRYSAETAFYGIQVVSSNVANGIISTFEGAFNTVIDGINNIISYINSLGFISLPTIGHVDFGGERAALRVDYTEAKFDEAYNKLQNAINNFGTTGTGQAWANEIASVFKSKFDALVVQSQNQLENTNSYSSGSTSTANTNSDELNNNILTDVNNLYEDYINSTTNLDNTSEDIETAVDSLDTLNTTLGEDGTYTVVTNADDSLNDLNDSLENVSTSAEDASEFIFAFSNNLFSSLSSSADSLLSIVSSDISSNEISYEKALENMQEIKEKLIENPLDKDIGREYASAFTTLQNSADSFLDINNFTSQGGYDFAAATVNTQLLQYQDTAAAGYDVLESMNDFLQSINTAFEDGILSDEEKATISGVADTVNQKNEILLGSSGVVGAVNNQEYYNNTGLATDSNISAQEYFNNTDVVGAVNNQEYYNNTGLATDSNISSQEYYNNSDTIAAVNSQEYYNNTGLATETAVNTVSDFINTLKGGASTGIQLSSIVSTLPDLSVSTGLDVSQLSNLSSIKSTSATAASATSYMTGNNSTSLKNLKLKSSKQTTSYFFASGAAATPSNYNTQKISSSYTYYAEGGFTGQGFGMKDSSGLRPAGIVHEDEWVAAPWMLKQNPNIFAQLEAIRQRGSFASGGYTSKTSPLNTIESSSKTSNKELEDIKQIGLKQTQQLMKLNKLLVRLSNGGQALLVETTSTETTTKETA